jgi:hypothetical protein
MPEKQVNDLPPPNRNGAAAVSDQAAEPSSNEQTRDDAINEKATKKIDSTTPLDEHNLPHAVEENAGDDARERTAPEPSAMAAAPNRLEALAHQLAQRHQQLDLAADQQSPHDTEQRPLPERLKAISALLEDAHQQLVTTSEEALAVSYAAEWLLDNYYAVEQALRQVKQDLPASYYRELPRLVSPARPPATAADTAAAATNIPAANIPPANIPPANIVVADRVDERLVGYPRVYDLARTYLLHEEFQINPE